jgi:hypothetical protein
MPDIADIVPRVTLSLGLGYQIRKLRHSQSPPLNNPLTPLPERSPTLPYLIKYYDLNLEILSLFMVSSDLNFIVCKFCNCR